MELKTVMKNKFGPVQLAESKMNQRKRSDHFANCKEIRRSVRISYKI